MAHTNYLRSIVLAMQINFLKRKMTESTQNRNSLHFSTYFPSISYIFSRIISVVLRPRNSPYNEKLFFIYFVYFYIYYSLTKLSLKGSYSVSKGGATCCAPVGSPICAPLVPPHVRSRGDAPLRLVPPQLDFPIGSPRIS